MGSTEEFMATTLLFKGIGSDEVQSVLGCLGARRKRYPKGAYLLHRGDRTSSLGLVLSGAVVMQAVDVWGNTSILGRASRGSVFAETYAAVKDEPLMVDVVALEQCEVLFLNVERILTTCSSACAHHALISRNLLAIFAQKNLALSRRAFAAAPKTIRGKLSAYLSFEAARYASDEFSIPFNRQELADYLGVDRSAMSAELGRMQKEGVLETRRSHFKLLDPDRVRNM